MTEASIFQSSKKFSARLLVFLALLVPQGSRAAEAPDTLVVEARLLEIPGNFPPNDLYNYVYVMKYRVLKILRGTFPDREILVGHYNPLIPRARIKDKMKKFVAGDVDKFEAGQKHRLTLIAPVSLVWAEAVEDEYFDSAQEKHFALDVKTLKTP